MNVPSGQRPSPDQRTPEQPKRTSTILLVNLKNNSDVLITPDDLYEVFSLSGPIRKVLSRFILVIYPNSLVRFNQILIFDRGNPLKAFIEFEEDSEAQEALETFNNRHIFPNHESKSNIFISKNKTLMFPSSSPNGKSINFPLNWRTDPFRLDFTPTMLFNFYSL